MTLLDTAIVVTVIGFLILAIWSRMMRKDIIEVLYDIKDFLLSFGQEQVEEAPRPSFQ